MLEFDHVGIAVRNLQDEVARFAILGYSPRGEFIDEIQGVSGVFLEGNGPRLELVQNLGDSKTLDPWLKQLDVRPYHFAYRTDEVDKILSELRGSGSKKIKSAEPAVAFPGMEICFMTFSNLLLIELISEYR